MITKEILDELYDLNSEMYEKNEELIGFTYESNGWYECIRFNEHVLWDSEDYGAWLHERPDFDEETMEDDYDPDIIGVVKRRFNEHLDSLFICKFDIP